MAAVKLSAAARAFRAAHALISIAFLLAIVPATAARRAVPVLGAVAGAGIVLLGHRSRS